LYHTIAAQLFNCIGHLNWLILKVEANLVIKISAKDKYVYRLYRYIQITFIIFQCSKQF